MAEQFANFNSRLVAGRIPPGKQSSTVLEEGKIKCCCWTTSDGLSVTAITDIEYPDKACFILISNMLLDFRETFAADPSMY